MKWSYIQTSCMNMDVDKYLYLVLCTKYHIFTFAHQHIYKLDFFPPLNERIHFFRNSAMRVGAFVFAQANDDHMPGRHYDDILS